MVVRDHSLVALALICLLPPGKAFTVAGPSCKVATATARVDARRLELLPSRLPTTNPSKSGQHSTLFERQPDPPMASSKPDVLWGVVTAVGKTASTAVSASFFVLLAYRRDALVLTLWIGSILNAIASKVAKRLLNHERPSALKESESIRLKPSDGGMPSSHAASLGFIGTVVARAIVPPPAGTAAGLAMAAYSAVALRYRVRDHLHTPGQVGAGLVLGVGNAIAWLRFATGDGGDGPVLVWVRDSFISAETGTFPYWALSVPILVGIAVVGSFERRIALWMKDRRKDC